MGRRMNHDAELKSITDFLRAIANRMAMDGQDRACASVHNAILSLRAAFSAEHHAALVQLDRERLEKLRASA